MNLSLLVVAVLAAVDPARVRLAVRTSVPGVPAATMAAGAALALGALGTLAIAGDALLSWLSVRPESWRIAAGIVMGFTGVHRLLTGMPDAEPTLSDRMVAVVPVGFPILFTPAAVVLAVSGGVDVGAVATVVAFAAALGIAGALSVAGTSSPDRLWLAASRLSGGILVVAAVAAIISGIADI